MEYISSLLPAPLLTDITSLKTISVSLIACVLLLIYIPFVCNNEEKKQSSSFISDNCIISRIRCEIQRRKLRKQGVNGPPPSFISGNVHEMHKIIQSSSSSSTLKATTSSTRAAASPKSSNGCSASTITFGHDYTFALFPYLEKWRKQYGPMYTYSTGNKQHLYISDPNVVREINQSMTLDLGKPTYVTKTLAPMLGNGILRSNGLLWAQQRKIIAPELFLDKVKEMVGLMREATEPLLRKWEAKIEVSSAGSQEAHIRLDEDLREAMGEVISRAFFGSSFQKGKEIFMKLRILQKLLSEQGFLFRIPNFRFLQSRAKREIRLLEKEIECLIWEAVLERVQECSNTCSSASAAAQKDLMQVLLDTAVKDHGLSQDSCKQFVVDNCKNIYFAGHESTAVSASWCLMLLASHPEWQHQVRAEFAKFCKDGHIPSVESLLKMKTITMVIQETLRLYTPAAFVSREALQDFHMGGIVVPKGVCIWTLIPALHRHPETWGPDALEFKPERFADGVVNACKVPQAYVPFGLGGRLCLGRNFAMLELKILVGLIVSKFSMALSPKYKHSPAFRMMIEPGEGVYVHAKKM